MLYSVNLLRTLAWDTAFQIALRECSKKVREKPGYIAVFAEEKKKHVFKHHKITANHKNKTFHVNDFSAFLCMARVLGSLKSFL